MAKTYKLYAMKDIFGGYNATPFITTKNVINNNVGKLELETSSINEISTYVNKRYEMINIDSDNYSDGFDFNDNIKIHYNKADEDEFISNTRGIGSTSTSGTGK